MKILILILAGLFVFLQYELWFAKGGVGDVWQHKKSIAAMKKENAKFKQRNDVLTADINDLKHGKEAVGEYARSDLGMVKKGEILYRVVSPNKQNRKTK